MWWRPYYYGPRKVIAPPIVVQDDIQPVPRFKTIGTAHPILDPLQVFYLEGRPIDALADHYEFRVIGPEQGDIYLVKQLGMLNSGEVVNTEYPSSNGLMRVFLQKGLNRFLETEN